jgi:hypothetical protein
MRAYSGEEHGSASAKTGKTPVIVSSVGIYKPGIILPGMTAACYYQAYHDN